MIILCSITKHAVVELDEDFLVAVAIVVDIFVVKRSVFVDITVVISII